MDLVEVGLVSMFKTKYAVEQHKGRWYALKCITLFGITVKTEYINLWGDVVFSSRVYGHTEMCSEEKVIELYKGMLKRNKELEVKNTKKRWIE